MSKYDLKHKLKKSLLYSLSKERGRAKLKKQEFSLFLDQYFSFLSEDELALKDPKSLYQLAKAHWDFAKAIKYPAIKVKVFNPSVGVDGWSSAHTVVQIVVKDMPFLVDTARMLFDRHGLTVHFSINAPQVMMLRDKRGLLQAFRGKDKKSKDGHLEAFLYFEIDCLQDLKRIKSLQQDLLASLGDVNLAVRDWAKMQSKAHQQIEALGQQQAFVSRTIIAESQAFLLWMLDGHFIFLGAREYKLTGKGKQMGLTLVPERSLGLLSVDIKHKRVVKKYHNIPSVARKNALSKNVLITMPETNAKATVHRPVYTICIAVKMFNHKGQIIGEQRFLGLYTSAVYQNLLSTIPILREKYRQVMSQVAFPERSYAWKAIDHVIETLPRDELFQLTVDELFEFAMGVFRIQERRVVRLFIRKDIYGRYYSCFVFIPRDNFNATVMNNIKHRLMEVLGGREVTFRTHFFETGLVRLHYLVRIDEKQTTAYVFSKLQDDIIQLGTSWYDGFREEMIKYFGEEKGCHLIKAYHHAFSPSYQQHFSVKTSVRDIDVIETDLQARDLVVKVCDFSKDGGLAFSLKIIYKEHPIPLSNLMPIMDYMGLKVMSEIPYQLNKANGDVILINDFHLVLTSASSYSLHDIQKNLEQAFYHIWLGDAENDSLNRLVLYANLSWIQVTIIRIYARYLRQIGFTFSPDYLAEVCCKRPDVTSLLSEVFACRFSPMQCSSKKRDRMCQALTKNFFDHLADVKTLDEDRIFRRLYDVIHATVRTNIYQVPSGVGSQATAKPYYSIKISSQKIPNMPKPVPEYEFFVYSPQHKGQHTGFEGIHIRFTQVARGGIRLSRRREDYRQEVLDLAKTQQVKNAVIVPSGAKGGFVPYYTNGEQSREQVAKESVACYSDYMRGMLDLTDNIVDGEIIKPKQTMCYDAHDTYFVVAADKGTATYSDVANAISREYNFWLSDAFASGGSAGYDHKKIGITAKGAWESVKHHFSMMDFDFTKHSFTVAGIGDMSGDVFGNGMLLSSNIKLVAAFNHMHIFIDPDPNTADSFNERSRLFGLPRSTWLDYDSSLVSKGGGVFSRSAKSISLSSEMKKQFSTDLDAVSPDECIKMILALSVDLLWNGGIGTYVKASTESNAQAHDHGNDAVRVNAKDMKCKMIVEGGNLGLTQRGRIEYEINGGRINTDFIDNSGGVDCSDHEVNIKIMLNQVVRDGQLTMSKRNSLLKRMTNSVSDLVLAKNKNQNKSITLAVEHSRQQIPVYKRYLTFLENKREINRKLEFLPTDKVLYDRMKSKQGFYRPEISILMAKTKNLLKKLILKSHLVDDPACQTLVFKAFPEQLHDKYAKQILTHKLKDQLIATQLSNLIVDEMGLIFAYQVHEETSCKLVDVVKAYVICRDIFSLQHVSGLLMRHDENLDASVSKHLQVVYVDFIRWSSEWFLRSPCMRSPCNQVAKGFVKYIEKYRQSFVDFLPEQQHHGYDQALEGLTTDGVHKDLAREIVALPFLKDGLTIINYNFHFGKSMPVVAKVYFYILNMLDLQVMFAMFDDYVIEDHWSASAMVSLRKKLDHRFENLLGDVLCASARGTDQKIASWIEVNQHQIKKWHHLLEDAQACYKKGQSQLATLSNLVEVLGRIFKKSP
jgi:glutamate dehydrogenase